MRFEKKLKLVVILFIGVIIGVCLGFVIGYTKATTLQKTRFNIGKPATLEIFRNPGFSFNYPSNWIVRRESENLVSFDPPNEGPNPYSSEKGEGTNLKDDIIVRIISGPFFKDFIKGAGPYMSEIEEIVIDGHKGYRYILGDGEFPTYEYLIKVDKDKFIEFSTADSGGLIDLLVSTLRF
ncbi:MAG: PsbP-related protein [bacterium]|nr:PsbP-related protein [bacterium]